MSDDDGQKPKLKLSQSTKAIDSESKENLSPKNSQIGTDSEDSKGTELAASQTFKRPSLRLNRDKISSEISAEVDTTKPKVKSGGTNPLEEPSEPAADEKKIQPKSLKLNRNKAEEDSENEIPPPAPKKEVSPPAPELKLNRKMLDQSDSVEEKDKPKDSDPQPSAFEEDLPPDLPTKPAPKLATRKKESIPELAEKSLDKSPADGDEVSKNKHRSTVISIFIILILFMIFIGAGAGIWYVLKDGSESPPMASSSEVKTDRQEEIEDSPTQGPIEKARQAVAQISTGEIEAITRSYEPEPRVAEEAPKGVPQTASSDQTTFVPTTFSNFSELEPLLGAELAGANPQGPNENFQAEVSEFLTNIQVSGIRTGSSARVMLNDISYKVGETVHPPTGLTFVGVDDGRLVFRDINGVTYLKSF